MSFHDLFDLEARPYLIAGEGGNALRICFESDETLRACRDIPVAHPEEDFETTLDNRSEQF